MALLVPAVLILLCYAYFVLHRLVSLRKVPAAHWSSRFTSARILWARWTNSELNLLIDAHRGDEVRVLADAAQARRHRDTSPVQSDQTELTVVRLYGSDIIAAL